ncbi:MAG: EVE domain-containing protein [Spirochaetia bacterium]|jgi:predicted RNA-binding protein with PUA-like domain
MSYWLAKSDPDTYRWPELVRDGTTSWTGVRNYWPRWCGDADTCGCMSRSFMLRHKNKYEVAALEGIWARVN